MFLSLKFPANSTNYFDLTYLGELSLCCVNSVELHVSCFVWVVINF